MPPTRFRWLVVGLLFVLTVVNYVDRAAISYAIPMIQRDLGLSLEATGTVLGAFGAGYALTTLAGGFAVDRYGARRVLALAALLWSLSIGATALASGLAMLYAARVLLGVAEGPNFPALTGAVSRWLSPHERARALSGALVAVPLALALGGPLVTELLHWLDWRWTFGVLFGLSIAWVPLWAALFRDSPAQSRFVNPAELAAIRTTETRLSATPAEVAGSWPRLADLWALLANRTLLANTWAFFVFGYFLFFFMTWLPSYLERQYALNLRAVGAFSVLPWLAAALLLVVAGRWADRVVQRGGSQRRASSGLIAGSQLVAALAVVPVALTSDLGVAIAGITLAVGAAMCANAAYYTVTVDIAPQRAATALGFMDFAFAVAGFVAPSLTGWVLELRGSFTDAFLLLSALALSSVLVVALFHHPDRDRRQA